MPYDDLNFLIFLIKKVFFFLLDSKTEYRPSFRVQIACQTWAEQMMVYRRLEQQYRMDSRLDLQLKQTLT